jgi:molybdate transport system substrate-binding protein
VVVFAASSLKEAFEELGSNLEKQGVEVEYNLGGSQALAAQLAQGARADVFASADLRNMQSAIDAGVIVSGTQRVLATNRLVVVTQGAGTGTGTGTVAITDLHDLMRPGLRLVLADRTVPVGNYSLQMLDRLAADPAYGPGFKERVLANVVSYENNVRQVLAKVQLGEADAGIVYATDASTTTLRTIPVPDRYSPLARYYIAPLKDAPHPQAASRFIAYALSDEGQQILQNHGFGRAQEGK